jgi:hypothetical protein
VVAFDAERCINCVVISDCSRKTGCYFLTFIVMRRLDIVLGVLDVILAVIQRRSLEGVVEVAIVGRWRSRSSRDANNGDATFDARPRCQAALA